MSSNAKETFYFSFLVTPGGGQANWHKIPAFANSFCAPALTSTLTNLQGVQHIDHLIKGGRSTHKDLYIDEEWKDMCILLEKKKEEKVLCAIYGDVENLYPAFCLLHQFEWLKFCCFLFYIFSILHIFQSGPANLWKGKLLYGVKFCNLAEMTCTIFVCATLRPQSWKSLWCLQMCALALCTVPSALCFVHCTVFADVCTCTVQPLRWPGVTRIQREQLQLSQKCKRSLLKVNMNATCTAVHVGPIS